MLHKQQKKFVSSMEIVP